MKKKYLQLILFFFSIISIAQIEDSKKSIKNSYITVNTLSLLRAGKPRFRVGYIQRLSNTFSLGCDVGYGNRNLAFSIGSISVFRRPEYALWEIRPQLFYFKKPKPTSKATGISYLSLEFFYIHYKDLFNGGNYLEKDIYYNYEQADFSNEQLGLNVIFGVFTNKRRRLGLNFYIGAGIGVETNTHENEVNLIQLEEEPFHDPLPFDFSEPYLKEGSYPIINFVLGVKVNLRLKKNQ